MHVLLANVSPCRPLPPRCYLQAEAAEAESKASDKKSAKARDRQGFRRGKDDKSLKSARRDAEEGGDGASTFMTQPSPRCTNDFHSVYVLDSPCTDFLYVALPFYLPACAESAERLTEEDKAELAKGIEAVKPLLAAFREKNGGEERSAVHAACNLGCCHEFRT